MTSKRVSTLSPGAELFYRKLLNVADDWGRFEADLAILRARCYPRQLAQITEAMVAGWLNECRDSKLVKLYRVNAATYLEVERFRQRHRYSSRYPEPQIARNLSKAVKDGPSHAEAGLSRAEDRPNTNLKKRPKSVKDGLSRAEDGLSRAEDGPSRAKDRPLSKAKAEADAKHLEASVTVSGNRNNKPRKISGNGRATARTRPVASPGATPPQRELEHSPEELQAFRAAIRVELGPDASEAEVERKFAEYTAPRHRGAVGGGA